MLQWLSSSLARSFQGKPVWAQEWIKTGTLFLYHLTHILLHISFDPYLQLYYHLARSLIEHKTTFSTDEFLFNMLVDEQKKLP